MSVTVGFDLDMTLVDSRRGVAAAIDRLAGEFGLPLDSERFAATLGPPLATLLAENGAPPELIPVLVPRYREIYPEIVELVPAMPGAAEAIAAVYARGGRVVVVTGKHEPLARLHLDHLGWRVDRLAGDLWSTAKAEVLRAEHADVYVGDHAGDMRAAVAATAVAVGVVTGPCDETELKTAGAEVLLSDLTGFPDWLAGFTRHG